MALAPQSIGRSYPSQWIGHQSRASLLDSRNPGTPPRQQTDRSHNPQHRPVLQSRVTQSAQAGWDRKQVPSPAAWRPGTHARPGAAVVSLVGLSDRLVAAQPPDGHRMRSPRHRHQPMRCRHQPSRNARPPCRDRPAILGSASPRLDGLGLDGLRLVVRQF